MSATRRVVGILGGMGPEATLLLMSRIMALSPCNTAHGYLPTIRAAVDVPFLDMIELTAAELSALDLPTGRVGMLASPAVRDVGLYHRAFAPHGLTPVFPEAQAGLLAAIRALKRDARSEEAKAIQMQVADQLLGACVDVLLIACTELSLIRYAVPAGARVVDAVDVLAGAITIFPRYEHPAGHPQPRLILKGAARP